MKLRRLVFASILILTNTSFAKPLTPVTLVLDWFINPDHAPIIVAKQQHFYQQQGLNVKIISPSSSRSGPKLVAAGKADIAIDYQPRLLLQIQQGLPLIQIGTLINQPLSCLTSLNIKNINKLKGKTIAHTAGSGVDDIILKTILNFNHVKLKQAKLVNVNYDLVQALLSKRVDAATGLMRNVEVIELEQMGIHPHVFLPEKNGFPTYDELIFVARYQHINENVMKHFLIATQEGVDYLRKHPAQTWQAFAKQYPEDNNALNKASWLKTVPLFANNPQDFSKEKYQKLMMFLVKKQLLHRAIPSNRYHYTFLQPQ